VDTDFCVIEQHFTTACPKRYETEILGFRRFSDTAL